MVLANTSAQVLLLFVLLLDEPLDAMDRDMRGKILAWIDDHCAADGLAVVVTHGLEPFVDRAQRVIAVDRGRVTEELAEDRRRRSEMLERLARSSCS